ncbi:hypothetical protein GOV07_00220 [Candidatus Woesearchaeota archaeon]|nr:hypothetical protein [Candidatus Woesearchaeota archaeon]
MSFKNYLANFVKTFNPDAYEKLSHDQSLKQAWQQFAFNFALIFIVMLLLFVPAILLGAPALEAKLDSFSQLQLDANASASEPIQLMTKPDIVIDLTDEEVFDTEELLINNKGITWKRFLLFGEKTVPWSDARDLQGTNSGTFVALFIFLLPSVAVWASIFSLIGYAIVILICGTLAWLLPKIWRHKLSFATAMKLSLYAATVLMLEMLLLPFWRNWWLFPLLYIIFLSIGVALVGERKLTHDRHSRKKGKKHDIWD